jgi:hypothetical protein
MNPLPFGASYRVTGYMKDAVGSLGRFRLRENAVMTGPPVSDDIDEKTLTSAWQKFDVTVTVDGGASMRIVLVVTSEPPDAGCAHLDDVCATRIR